MPTIINPSNQTITQYDVQVGAANNLLASVGPGSVGQILLSGGNAANPSYVTPTSSGSTLTVTSNSTTLNYDIAAPVSVANGGTGDESFTAYSVITGGTTSTGALQNVSGVGSSGQVLTSNGAGSLPTWQAAGGGGGLTSVTVTLTSAQIKALNVTPIQLVAAPGAGNVVVVVAGICKFTYGGSNAFTGSSGSINLYWGTSTSSINNIIPNSIMTGTSTLALTTGSSNIGVAGTALTNIENMALNAFNNNSAFSGNAANNNTVTINIVYYIATI
jgi:hypothetical protein